MPVLLRRQYELLHQVWIGKSFRASSVIQVGVGFQALAVVAPPDLDGLYALTSARLTKFRNVPWVLDGRVHDRIAESKELVEQGYISATKPIETLRRALRLPTNIRGVPKEYHEIDNWPDMVAGIKLGLQENDLEIIAPYDDFATYTDEDKAVLSENMQCIIC